MPKDTSDKPKRKAAEKAEKAPRAARGAAKERAAKPPVKAKRALSAYMFFVQDQRESIKEEHPDAKFGEIGKLLGARWKQMSDAEKKPYNDKAAKDKAWKSAAKGGEVAAGGDDDDEE